MQRLVKRKSIAVPQDIHLVYRDIWYVMTLNIVHLEMMKNRAVSTYGFDNFMHYYSD